MNHMVQTDVPGNDSLTTNHDNLSGQNKGLSPSGTYK